jgi:hypothetical protein
MREKLAAVAVRGQSWLTLLLGIQALVEVTVDHGKTSYEAALIAWQAWQRERAQTNLVAVQERPYLAAVLSVCDTRAASRANKFPPYPEARCPGGSLMAVDAVVNFLSSPAVDAVYNEHCLNKVSESMSSFFTRVQMSTAILVGPEQLEKCAPDVLVGRITSAPVADLHAQADQHLEFNDPQSPVVSKIPHQSEVRMVSTVVIKIMEGPLFVPALQREASAPIAKEDIVALLAMHANGWLLIILLSTCHVRLFGSNGSITNTQGGLDVTVIGALVGLRRAYQKMVETLRSDKYAHIDEHGYGLNQSVEFVGQWLRCVNFVTDAFVSSYMSKALELIKKTATDLVNTVPRWEMHITETVFNVGMAIETVLEPPKKSQLPSITAKLHQMLAAVATATELLQPTEPPLGQRPGHVSGIMNHAEAACKSSDTVKLIGSALNAILIYGRKQGGQTMSKEILEIDAGNDYKGAKIPATLRRLLEGVRDGDTSVLDGIEPYKPPTKKNGKHSKKRKRNQLSGDEATREDGLATAEVPGGVSPGGSVKAELDDTGAEAEGHGCSAPASPSERSGASAPPALQRETSTIDAIDVDMDGF